MEIILEFVEWLKQENHVRVSDDMGEYHDLPLFLFPDAENIHKYKPGDSISVEMTQEEKDGYGVFD